MALTINNFWGAETDGLEESFSTTGTIDVTAGAAHSGGYGYVITGSGTNELDLDPFETIADAGTGYVVGFWAKKKTALINADAVFQALEGTTIFATIHLQADGDVSFRNATTELGITTTQPISLDTWHYFELYFQHSNSAAWELFVDGNSVLSGSGDDLDEGSTFDTIRFEAVTNDVHLDDIYFMSGATGATDRLGGCEVFAYRSDLNSATPDTDAGAGSGRSVLDDGTWDLTQTIPFAATKQASYNDTGAGSVKTDDVGGSSGGGPSGDTNITGDIKAIKGICTMLRSGGGVTEHYILLGNSVDGTTRSADLDPTTGFITYFMVSESASIVPTSSESCQIGFEMTNAQDFDCAGMLATILHVPAAVSAFPYHLRRIKRADMDTLINL
jgi:hypothetical protein